MPTGARSVIHTETWVARVAGSYKKGSLRLKDMQKSSGPCRDKETVLSKNKKSIWEQ